MMKILGVLPVSIGGRLTTSSILDGFRMLGHSVTVYDELMESSYSADEYDLIVGYDFSPIKLKKDNNLSTKCIAYFSDEIRNKTSGPYWEELLPELDNKDNYIFYWDRELAKLENFKNLFYLPHFVNTDIYKNLHLPPECDVMFAGRLDTDYRLNMIESIAQEYNLHWYAIERHYLDALKRAKNKALIEKIYKGFIDNEEDMARAINKSKVVINMNSQGISSLNYRTMQTLACGKLLISDRRAELDLFDNRIPVYDDIESLKQNIDYFLSSSDEYKQVCDYCSRVCRHKFNSVSGAEFMLKKITISN